MRTVAFLALVSLLSACTSDTTVQQQARGEAGYTAYCEACHDRDEGVGPRLTPAVLASRMTAARLYAYNRDKMPYNAGQSLSEQQYWDITAYLLQRSGLARGDQPLAARTADYALLLPTE